MKETSLIITYDERGEHQIPMFTCAHCGISRPVAASGGYCRNCQNPATGFGLICQNPACHKNCNRYQLNRMWND